MALAGDPWEREYNDAVELAEDITNMITERSSLPATGPESQRYSSALRRKITILATRVDTLRAHLSKYTEQQPVIEEEIDNRQGMLANLRMIVQQMASTVNMSKSANIDSLLGPGIEPSDAMSRATGIDDYGIVGLQRQIMKEQDEDLEKLKEAIMSTKHIALAINEELDLHTRLTVDVDEHVEVTDSRLQGLQRRLAILNKQTKGRFSCLCLLLSFLGIAVLVALIYVLIKYL